MLLYIYYYKILQVCREGVHMMDTLGAKVLDTVFILLAYAMDMTTVEMVLMKRTVVGDNSQ